MSGRRRAPMDRGERAYRYRNALVYVTWRCQLYCPRCYLRACDVAGRPDMTWDQWQRIVDRLADGRHSLGTLHITGGEPTLWPHLARAVDYARYRLKVHTIRVISNGVDATAANYGTADRITISSYGALNRLDIARLKRELGRRLRIRWSVHYPWPYPQPSTTVDALPSVCGCVHMSFAGDYVYPCAMAAAWETSNRFLVASRGWHRRLLAGAPDQQEICAGCLNNVRIKPPELRNLTVEAGLWHSERGVLWRL